MEYGKFNFKTGGQGISTPRNISLDIARIIAVLFVVMIHCSGVFVVGFQDAPNGFLVGNILDSISRPGVALFLMISGALMLDESKKKSTRDMLVSAKNILILLVLWLLIYSLLYNIITPLVIGQPIKSFSQLVYRTINGHVHMWYLYMIIGIYLATPFIRKFVKKENKNLILLYLVISLCTTFVQPMLTFASGYFSPISLINNFISQLRLGFFNCYMTYYIMGWYIVHIGIDKKWIRKTIYSVAALSLVLMITLTQLTGKYNEMYAYDGILVLLYSLGIFLFVNNCKPRFSEKTKSFILLLSKLSFGVYIIHPMFNALAEEYLKSQTNPLIHIPIRFAFVIIVSFVASYGISKIPLVKKIIRG